MTSFNNAVISEGLRIEVENDLYQNEDVMDKDDDDELEKLPSVTLNTESTKSPSEIKDYESGPEDGEVSDDVGSPAPYKDNDDEDMEVDEDEEEDPRGVDNNNEAQIGRRGSNTSSSHEISSSMTRFSASSSGATDTTVNGYRPRTYPNPYLTDVLVSEEKLNSRAARFGISATESQPGVSTKPVLQPLPSDQELLDLYVSLGLIEDDGGEITLNKVGKQYRLNSILIRGTNQMSTNEIFAYLRDSNQRPLEMEWVNDACCVVIYKDKYEAARTLLSITKPIVVEPRPEKKTDLEEGETGELDEETEEMSQDFDFYAAETIPSRYIIVPMPPGYTWRFSVPCKQARGILMRYATIHDKKQEKAERHSEYYKKFGNPNFPGFGITSTSMKKRLRKQRPDDSPISPSKIVVTTTVDPEEPVSNRTAWSQLSQNWNDEESGIKPKPQIQFDSSSTQDFPKRLPVSTNNLRESTRNRIGPIVHRQPLPVSPDKNVRSLKVVVDFDEPRPSIHSRLKRRREEPIRRRHNRDDDIDEEDNDGYYNEEGGGARSYNRRRDEDGDEDKGSNSDSDDDSDNEESRWSKKLKGPRMRMHADEEEEKIMRARQASTSASSSSRYHSKAGKLAHRLSILRSNRR